VKRVGPCAPNRNAHVERFVQTLRKVWTSPLSPHTCYTVLR
jgi:hypothetical protein